MQQRSVRNKLPSIFWSQSPDIDPGYKNWMSPVAWVDHYPWTGMIAVAVRCVISFSNSPSVWLSKWKLSVYTEQRYFCCVVYISILWIRKWQHLHLEILSPFFLPLVIICILKKYTFFVFLLLLSPLAVPWRKVLRYVMVFSPVFRHYFKVNITPHQDRDSLHSC